MLVIGAPFSRTRFLVATNYGRTAGWYVELEGRRVGTLSDCRWVDMFWDSYVVGELDGVDASALAATANWDRCRFRFRNRESGEVVETAFCGGGAPFPPGRRVSMRGLYLRPGSRMESLLVTAVGLVWPRGESGG